MPVVNSIQIATVLTAFSQVAWPGTRISANNPNNVYVRQEWTMAANDRWPAMLITDKTNRRKPDSTNAYLGNVRIVVKLYDEWTQDNTLLDAKWAQLDTDMENVIANISNNPSLVVGNTPHAVAVQDIETLGYEDGILKANINGKDLIYHSAEFVMSLLPYDVP